MSGISAKLSILRFNTPLHAHKVLAAFIDYCKVYPLDKEVVQITIDICKQSRIKLPDAIIAATSIFHHFTLITRNIDDFKDIAGLKYVNPWKI
ncbi:hypothetical protein AGMMS4956_17030 [Bacteroidia bacterium]|nr:hypothetical protein AGMMS4956_17030 [Bacteroidia bacterium]